MLDSYLDRGVKKPLDVWVRTLKAGDGERYSLLVTDTGAPAFYPNVFLTSMRRGIGLAATTSTRDGLALAHLLVWADRAGIDLDERFAAGALLTPTEVQAYARAAKRYMSAARVKRPLDSVVASPPMEALSGFAQRGLDLNAVLARPTPSFECGFAN